MDRETAEPDVQSFPGVEAKEHVSNWSKVAAKSTHYYEFVWDLKSEAEGPFCRDIDGNVFIDFASHGGAAPLGYNNSYIMEKLEEFDLIDPSKIYGQGFYYSHEDIPSSLDLMEKLAEINEYGLDMSFLSNSGAEAVENGIKIAYNDTGNDYGVCFEGAFHGRTLGALSLNRSKNVYRRGFPEVHKIESVPFCLSSSCSRETCSCGFLREDGSLLSSKILEKNSNIREDDIAYIILEPVQGEGGLNYPSEEFMSEVSRVARDSEAKLIVDEVQAGLGRTGEMWASDHYSISPDIICSAKGLRVGGTIASSETFPDDYTRMSSTWGGGDVISSAVGYYTIEAIQEKNLLSNAKEKGSMIKERIKDKNIPKVEDVRGKGLFIGIELDSKKSKKKALLKSAKNGLLLTSCGDKTLRVMPPLDVREREVEIGVNILEKTLENV